ncbi:hypothetical protein [Arthrobacter sp. ok362]|uniref:hypothetical protein n=1 Tax=Arthrobacter sp. ok362 TaxID=1761745 RepID=UPI00088AF0E8|nr:hypothetical protein [Arthrobacter sp. ok362]SDL35489.1 hypothetical protein SAMN04487913_108198 [Arthrobacter sp. ok362]
MGTVTLGHSGIRGLLKAANAALEPELHAVLTCDEDYARAAKAACDYDDATASRGSVDTLANHRQARPRSGMLARHAVNVACNVLRVDRGAAWGCAPAAHFYLKQATVRSGAGGVAEWTPVR